MTGRTKDPRRRKYKVPRGTGAEVARELGLAPTHVGLCIKGKRTPGPQLYEALCRREPPQRSKR